MYNSHFGFRQTPFSVTPNPDFFYTNSLYQEALATLRYGIEARKGLILITGEVGTGKTILLRRFMRSLEATTRSVFIFYTHVSFADLLRLILRDLGLEAQSDRLTMIEKLSDYVIAQSAEGTNVSLLIDEAQNLSDEAFEGIRFLSNLDTDKEKLLQIVLMGQPELETKLDQPKLRNLKQRVAIRRHLAPLKDTEVGSYIDFRLQAAGFRGKGLFSADAVRRIALYSNGIPRLINIICDNALLIAHANSKKKVAAKMIEQVALDLRLKQQAQAKTEAPAVEFSQAKAREKVAQTEEDDAVVDEQWKSGFEELQVGVDRRPIEPHHRGLAGAGAGILLPIVLFAGAGLAFFSQQTRTYLSDFRQTVNDIVGIREQDPQQPKHSIEALMAEASAEGSHVQAPSLGHHALPVEERRDVSPIPETEKPTESEASGPAVENVIPISPSKPSKGIKATPEKPAPIKVGTDSEIARQRLRIQIVKAIHNRAITGVEVYVTDGTAYLDGWVETERQKSAAEQAARSVPGVKYVHNRIVANSLPVPSEKEQVGLKNDADNLERSE